MILIGKIVLDLQIFSSGKRDCMKKGHALSKLASGTRPDATALAVVKIVEIGFVPVLNNEN